MALRTAVKFSHVRSHASGEPECLEQAIYLFRTLLDGISLEDPRHDAFIRLFFREWSDGRTDQVMWYKHQHKYIFPPPSWATLQMPLQSDQCTHAEWWSPSHCELDGGEEQGIAFYITASTFGHSGHSPVPTKSALVCPNRAIQYSATTPLLAPPSICHHRPHPAPSQPFDIDSPRMRVHVTVAI